VKAAGVRSAKDGAALLHNTAYYTLNKIPDGDRIIGDRPRRPPSSGVAPVPAAANAPTAKHPRRRKPAGLEQ